jgi:RHS repeat-associated protein
LTLTIPYDFNGHPPLLLYRVFTVIATLDNAPTDLAPASKDDSFSYVHGPGIDDHRSRGRLGGDCHRQPAGRDEQERTSQWITELGLYDYRNRIYSSELGRFLQTDPIRFDAGDVNLYRYVANDTINDNDPDGLQGGRRGHGPNTFKKKCCVEKGGRWLTLAQALGMTTRQCANYIMGDANEDIPEALILVGLYSIIKKAPIAKSSGAGLAIGLAAQYALALSLCASYDCY